MEICLITLVELPSEQKIFIYVLFCIENKSYMYYVRSDLTLKINGQ